MSPGPRHGLLRRPGKPVRAGGRPRHGLLPLAAHPLHRLLWVGPLPADAVAALPGARRAEGGAGEQDQRAHHCAGQCCGFDDILGWIRIRIRGAMPMTNGSGSGSWIRILLFSSLIFKMPAKNLFFNTILSAYYFLKLHSHHFSKIKSQKESLNSRN